MPSPMTVYSYDYDTGAFTGERILDASDLDPRSPGVVLMPGNTTKEPPPRCGKRLWPMWTGDGWTVCQLPPDFADADYYANL